ncbi:Hypothetical protein A7982_05754 [Minicystis rosea]|nr:Hypothetical protein A7982_05754 [Minicystis rosea]
MARMAKSSTTKAKRPSAAGVRGKAAPKTATAAKTTATKTTKASSTRAKKPLLLPSRRDGSKPVALSPSLGEALARSPAPLPWGKELLPLGAKGGVLRSVFFAGELSKLLPIDAKWDEDAERPALVPLAFGGDQRHYLFVAAPDADGEYAVVALTDEPSVFVKYASVEHLLASASDAKIPAADAKRFARALAAAKKRLGKRLAREQFVLDEEEAAPDSCPTPKVDVGPAGKAVKVPPLEESLEMLEALDDLYLYTKKYTVAAEKVIAALTRAGRAAHEPLRERIVEGDVPSAWAAAHALLLVEPTIETALFVIGTLERADTMVDVGIVDRVFPFDDLLRKTLGPDARTLLERAVSERAARGEQVRAHVMFGYRAFDEQTGDELLARMITAAAEDPSYAKAVSWIVTDFHHARGKDSTTLAQRIPKQYRSLWPKA